MAPHRKHRFSHRSARLRAYSLQYADVCVWCSCERRHWRAVVSRAVFDKNCSSMLNMYMLDSGIIEFVFGSSVVPPDLRMHARLSCCVQRRRNVCAISSRAGLGSQYLV